MKRIEFSQAIVTNEAPFIILRIKEGAQLDVAEMKEIIEASEQLAEEKPYLLLSDARVFLSISPEGRAYAAEKNSKHLLANAVLVNNLAVRLTANFFIRFNKPPFKYRIFTSEIKAKEWLLRFKGLTTK